MKLILSILMIGIATLLSFAQDTAHNELEYKSDSTGKVAIEAYANYSVDNDTVELEADIINAEANGQTEKSLQQQAEEIPVVFGQWWFWVGLFSIILFLKFVIFKK